MAAGHGLFFLTDVLFPVIVQAIHDRVADIAKGDDLYVVGKIGMLADQRAAEFTGNIFLAFFGKRPIVEQRGGMGIRSIFIDDHHARVGQNRRGINNRVRRLGVFFLLLRSDVKKVTKESTI